VVEEQNGSGQTIKQFLWGLQYIDELVQTSLNSSPTTKSSCDVLYWACQDANWNVLGIVSSTGVLTERYEYSPYGQRTVFTSAGSNDPMVMGCMFNSNKFVISSVAQPYGICEVGHQGLFHDEESGKIYVRSREFDPNLGRWDQRDYLGGYADGMNLYQDERSNPVNMVDPSGKGFIDCCKAIAKLAIAEHNLEWRLLEAIDPDPNHIKSIKQAQNSVENALKTVMDNCGGTAAGAAAIASAKALIEQAEELYQAWQEAGEPIPVP
jgi:RHS repeat-associated protein